MGKSLNHVVMEAPYTSAVFVLEPNEETRMTSGCRLIEISGSSGKVISFVIDSKLSIFMF